MQHKSNSVTLLLLIILGVAVGNLTSSWLMTKFNQAETNEVSSSLIEKIDTNLPNKPELTETQNEITRDSASEPSDGVTEKSIEESANESIRETVKLSPKDQAETEEITPPAGSEELIEQRRLDENGLRLSKKCNEWTTVHKDMNTGSSERGMTKHCAEYYDYLSFGALPDSS